MGVIGLCIYLRTTDIVIDYFISFHSSHIVPIHLTGSHIEQTATLILATTFVFDWRPLKVLVVVVADFYNRKLLITPMRYTETRQTYDL